MRLFSYCIPFDDGAAPNPFGGICTLTICKPVIRRVAEIGDWVIATGSKNSPIGDISRKAVYIMEVTNKLSLREYNEYCLKDLQIKIPDLKSTKYEKKVGDCIYYYSKSEKLIQREGVHNEINFEIDTRGKNSLLSENFYYFGDSPIELPEDLLSIVKDGQGHRSVSNDKYIPLFLEWVNNLNLIPNKLYGKPQISINFKSIKEMLNCSRNRCDSGREDEKENKKGIC
jgi:hypothetical protein